MRKLIFLFFITSMCASFSQKEAANWYFGQNAGLDFNSGTPLPLLDGQVRTVEGSASISDANGNLLFYTDGITIWNRRHQIMANGEGLKGSSSSSQTALIVPDPTNSVKYYIFTTDDALLADSDDFNGFNYNVVDMSLDNGAGAVIEKNIELLPVGSEKVSGVLNFEDNHYWVITHYVDRFYAYKVDGNGVNTNPVISIIGPSVTNFANGRGSLKLSPDGRKLAMSYLITEPRYASNLFVFDFDAQTGVVSNPDEALGHTRAYYGLEFSSNSNRLYASGVNFDTSNQLQNIDVVQFDLERSDFFDSETVVLNFDNESDVFVAGALQIGLDKRIYHSLPSPSLSVIRNPNAEGQLIDAERFRIDLGGRATTFGLPPFVQSFFETVFDIESFCFGTLTTFTPEDSTNISSISWDFGDPDSGAANFSNSLVGEHHFSSAGTFQVTIAVAYGNGATREFVEYVDIKEIPNVLQNVELIQCDIDGTNDGITSFNLLEAIPLFNIEDDTITASFFTSEADAVANVGEITPIGYTNAIEDERVYARVFKDPECFVVVDITLSVEPITDLGLYDTLYICDGILSENSVTANLSQVAEQLSEDFIDGDITLYLNSNDALLELDPLAFQDFSFNTFPLPELFFRVEYENTCAFVARVALKVFEIPNFEEQLTLALCSGRATLTALAGYADYLWSTGATDQTIEVTETGLYDVVFANGKCAYTQTIEVLPEPEIDIAEIVIEDFNRNNRIQIILGADEFIENTIFSIDGGQNFQNANTFSNVLPGLYELIIDNGCSIYGEEIVVGGLPSFFTPNGDDRNETWNLDDPIYFPEYKVSIFSRYGTLLFSFDSGQQGWDGRYQNQDMPADSYWYALELGDGRVFKGSFVLKR